MRILCSAHRSVTPVYSNYTGVMYVHTITLHPIAGLSCVDNRAVKWAFYLPHIPVVFAGLLGDVYDTAS